MKKKKLFKDVAEEWLEFHRAKVKNYTYLMYARYVKNLILEFQKYQISQITSFQVQKFLNNLCSLGYAKSTISKYRLTLQQISNYAIRCDYAIKNCCIDTYIPKDAKVKIINRVSDEDIEKVLLGYNHYFGLFALFLLTFGLRRSEALALTWEDIDVEAGYIRINKVIEYDKSTPILCHYLKNGSKEKIIPILPMVYDILKKQKEDKTGIIFSHNGEHLHRSRCAKLWDRYLLSNKMNINMHQLRHTYATLLYKAGVDLKTAMELMGHKDMTMLLKIYTHPDVETLTINVIQLNDFMLNKYQIK